LTASFLLVFQCLMSAPDPPAFAIETFSVEILVASELI
jgi:hypothetical protein